MHFSRDIPDGMLLSQATLTRGMQGLVTDLVNGEDGIVVLL